MGAPRRRLRLCDGLGLLVHQCIVSFLSLNMRWRKLHTSVCSKPHAMSFSAMPISFHSLNTVESSLGEVVMLLKSRSCSLNAAICSARPSSGEHIGFTHLSKSFLEDFTASTVFGKLLYRDIHEANSPLPRWTSCSNRDVATMSAD